MKPPIDWRELYAANQAVIHGARERPQHTPSPPPVPRRGAPLLRRLRSGAAGALREGSRAQTARSGHRADVIGEGDAWLTIGGRRVLVHTPPGLDTSVAAPLVVMLHGCTQDPADFARGTGMNAAADADGFVVAYPEQPRSANPQGCWNWFAREHQGREGGEPASIAAVVEALKGGKDHAAVDPQRVYVAGMSAGGAMAGVLGATWPDLFAGVAIHSGLPYGTATGVGAALQAMTRGTSDPAAAGRAAHTAMGAAVRPLPVLVIHGDADRTVRPCNGAQTAEQWCETNRLATGAPLVAESAEPLTGGRSGTRRRWRDPAGRVLVECLELGGLGHAWSGGSASGSHTDPTGLDATAAIVRFFGLADPLTVR
jgi:poly(hydroxyalkanoate) depolymerase family esterase